MWLSLCSLCAVRDKNFSCPAGETAASGLESGGCYALPLLNNHPTRSGERRKTGD